MTRRERRVLTLRAGLGGERPQSRRRVARTLHLSAQQVGRLERRGIRRLVRAGRCDTDAVTGVGGGTISAGQGITLARLAATGPFGLVTARPSAPPSDRVEVKSEHKSSGGGTPARAPDVADELPPPPAAIVGGADLTFPLLGLLLAAGLLVAARAARRARGR